MVDPPIKALCVLLLFCLSWGLSWLGSPLAELRRKIPAPSHISSYIGVRVLLVRLRGSRVVLWINFSYHFLLPYSRGVGANSLLSPCQTLIARIDSGVLLVEGSKINPTTSPPIAQPQFCLLPAIFPSLLNPESLITSPLSLKPSCHSWGDMRLLTSGLWLLGGLLPFSLVVHSRDVDPTEDFCSLRSHMSRILPSLLKHFVSLFIYHRYKYIVAQKDDILYIAGGHVNYLKKYKYYNGPSLYPLRMYNPPPFPQTNDSTTW